MTLPSREAASLAGHLGLHKLIWIYDNNKITIEGHTEWAFSEDVATKFFEHFVYISDAMNNVGAFPFTGPNSLDAALAGFDPDAARKLLEEAGWTRSNPWMTSFVNADPTLPGRPIDALRENRGSEVKRRAQSMGF